MSGWRIVLHMDDGLGGVVVDCEHGEKQAKLALERIETAMTTERATVSTGDTILRAEHIIRASIVGPES